jgi:hypothetical protein
MDLEAALIAKNTPAKTPKGKPPSNLPPANPLLIQTLELGTVKPGKTVAQYFAEELSKIKTNNWEPLSFEYDPVQDQFLDTKTKQKITFFISCSNRKTPSLRKEAIGF